MESIQLIREIQSLKQKVTQYDQLVLANDILAQKVSNLESKLKVSRKEVQHKESQFKDLTNQCQEQQLENKDIMKSIRQLNQQLEEMDKTKSHMKKKSQMSESEAQQYLEQLKKENEELSSLKQMKQEYYDLQIKCNLLEKVQHIYQQKYQETQSKIIHQEQNSILNNNIQLQCERKQLEFAELQKELGNFKRMQSTLKSEISSFQQKSNESLTEVQQYKDQIVHEQAKIEQIKYKVKNIQEKMALLTNIEEKRQKDVTQSNFLNSEYLNKNQQIAYGYIDLTSENQVQSSNAIYSKKQNGVQLKKREIVHNRVKSNQF